MSEEQMPKKANDIASLRKVCRPTPLSGKELDAFFVETDEARDPHRNTRQSLAVALEEESVSVLFYGHQGCGKSTEINKFLAEREDDYLPVRFSVLDEMTPTNAQAEDLILVVIERLLQAADSNNIVVPEERLRQVYGWFEDTTREDRTGSGRSVSKGAGVDASLTPLGNLLGLFAKYKGEIKYDSYSEETAVFKLRKRPADLLARANELFRAIDLAMERKPGEVRKLLVVIEDMDKLDLKQARDIYIENANLLTGLDVRALYTIPIYLFHSPDANLFKAKFTHYFALPMIMTWDPAKGSVEGDGRTPGFEKIRELILLRVDAALFEEDALDELIARTGGVLRHVFQVLQVVSTMTDESPTITCEHIEYGLKQVRKELWQMIALPLNGFPSAPDSIEALYQRLSEYALEQRKGNKPLCNSDATNQILLKSCALVEYNGEGWFGVHPLVVENLEKLGRLKPDGS